MNSAFTNWLNLGKHAGAMLMAPAMLAIGILIFSYFSWNRQMIEEVSLLGVVMEIKVEMERTHMLLHELERDLIILHDLKMNQDLLEETEGRMLNIVDRISDSVSNLNRYVSQTLDGPISVDADGISRIHIKRSTDEELIKRFQQLQQSVTALSDYFLPRLSNKKYQTFVYDADNDLLFEEALENAQASENRVHAIIGEKLDLQRRIFLLFVISFSALTAFIFFKWRQLSKKHADSLADLYLTSHATEQCRDIVMITDMDGIIYYANPHFTAVTGYQNHEAVGQHISWLLADNATAVLDAVADNRVWEAETENRTKNGRIFKTQTSVSPILDRANKPAFCVIRQKTLSMHPA